MAIPFRSWSPTKSEADLLVDMLTARLAPAKIAKTLYIDVRTLRNFLERLDAAMDTSYPEIATTATAARADTKNKS
jgi:hypothetical protein